MNSQTRHHVRKGTSIVLVTMLTVAILVIFLSPFAFMVFTSLKTQDQISVVGAPIWPAAPPVYEYNGQEYEIYTVPVSQCEGYDPNDTSEAGLALIKKGGRKAPLWIPLILKKRYSLARYPGAPLAARGYFHRPGKITSRCGTALITRASCGTPPSMRS